MSELAQVDTKHSSLFEALAAAQAEFLPVTKNKYYLRSKGGPKIWYAELSEILAAVRPALNRHGIFLFQRVETAQAGVTVETVVAHASGETLSSGKLFMPSIASVADRMRTDAHVEEKKRLAGKTFCSTSWCRHVARIDELLDKLHALKAEALK